MVADRIYEIVSIGGLLLACKAWYDWMHYLEYRERVRACDLLVNRGLELLQLAIETPRIKKKI